MERSNYSIFKDLLKVSKKEELKQKMAKRKSTGKEI